jgi:hypothetical protein
VPTVAVVPDELFGVSVKLPVPPTVKVPLLAVLLNCKSGVTTVSVSDTVQVDPLKLLVPPVQLVPALIVPDGVAIVAVFVTLPLVAVTVVVTTI